ncbi:hypothetical protein Efla_002220 [Eimeria flavescens]
MWQLTQGEASWETQLNSLSFDFAAADFWLIARSEERAKQSFPLLPFGASRLDLEDTPLSLLDAALSLVQINAPVSSWTQPLADAASFNNALLKRLTCWRLAASSQAFLAFENSKKQSACFFQRNQRRFVLFGPPLGRQPNEEHRDPSASSPRKRASDATGPIGSPLAASLSKETQQDGAFESHADLRCIRLLPLRFSPPLTRLLCDVRLHSAAEPFYPNTVEERKRRIPEFSAFSYVNAERMQTREQDTTAAREAERLLSYCLSLAQSSARSIVSLTGESAADCAALHAQKIQEENGKDEAQVQVYTVPALAPAGSKPLIRSILPIQFRKNVLWRSLLLPCPAQHREDVLADGLSACMQKPVEGEAELKYQLARGIRRCLRQAFEGQQEEKTQQQSSSRKRMQQKARQQGDLLIHTKKDEAASVFSGISTGELMRLPNKNAKDCREEEEDLQRQPPTDRVAFCSTWADMQATPFLIDLREAAERLLCRLHGKPVACTRGRSRRRGAADAAAEERSEAAASNVLPKLVSVASTLLNSSVAKGSKAFSRRW